MSAALERGQPRPMGRVGPWRWIAGGLAMAFGIATIGEGGSVLLGGAEAKAAAGEVVPFVLVFNFAAGFFYVAAGAAALAGSVWATWLARGLAVSTALVFAALGVHVLQGGGFEARTVAAMTVRTLFWVALALPRVLPPRRMR